MKSMIRVDENNLLSVTKAMNLALLTIKAKSKAGLIAAGIHILGVSNDNVPIEYGVLKASGTVIWDKSPNNGNSFQGPVAIEEKAATRDFVFKVKKTLHRGDSFDVAVGYGSTYAIFVHEDMGMNHPNGGTAKFLSKALAREKSKILNIIKDHAGIK